MSNSGSSAASPTRAFPSSYSAAMTSSNTAASSFLNRDPMKLAVIPSAQNPQVKGAVRSVKFSPSPSIDLLAFTEHVSYFNIIDARTFDLNSKQSIRLGTIINFSFDYIIGNQGADSHISGSAFSPDSRSLFIGTYISMEIY